MGKTRLNEKIDLFRLNVHVLFSLCVSSSLTLYLALMMNDDRRILILYYFDEGAKPPASLFVRRIEHREIAAHGRAYGAQAT